MDTGTLKEYIDACRVVTETEDRLKALRKQVETHAVDIVKGSNPQYPYQAVTFHIEGVEYGKFETTEEIRRMEKSLSERVELAKEKRLVVEEWLNTVPVRIQRIVTFRYIDGLSWDDVGRKCGNFTGDAVRMELSRYLKENCE